MNNKSTFITKYKPNYINEFTNNSEFIELIEKLNELDNMNILFVGNSNSGKTTLLNCIARSYYGLSTTERIPENNTLHINTLKEQGIQYFRNEMKTFCQSKSAIYGKKKLVLIDDIDTINEQSQQVFRNYIDKYNKNIFFISTCNNIQKVIESLQSRLHIASIPKHTNIYMMSIMKKIIQNENIELNDEVQDYLIEIANGSLRKLINYIEKCYLYKDSNTLKLETVKILCSSISFSHFDKFYHYLEQKYLASAIKTLFNIYDYGYSVIDILDYLFYYTKHSNLIEENTKYEVIILLCKYITIFHNIHEDPIELAFIANNIYEKIHK
tara:strand:- start:38072 stop:39049 length:978 start_codon:yes stop_codon:yes gene_type:complete